MSPPQNQNSAPRVAVAELGAGNVQDSDQSMEVPKISLLDEREGGHLE